MEVVHTLCLPTCKLSLIYYLAASQVIQNPSDMHMCKLNTWNVQELEIREQVTHKYLPSSLWSLNF